MPLAAGSRLGPYEIVSALGEGGMGEVYKGRDTRLDWTVAIKVAREQFSDRFAGEARAISALNHPNICTLYDVGPNYLVMEYIDGRPVAGPLAADQVLRLGAQMAAALDAAHRQGIVHRDLKPANILVTKAGVKLLDFGLAKRSGAAGAAADQTITQARTQEGTITGTIQYMAPEQLEGREADARSDIFALGLVLYELFTGRRAFEAGSTASLIAAVMKTEPAPLTPPALDRVVARCLAKDPDERWQSARDLKAELEWLAAGSGAHAAPAGTAKGGRSRWAAWMGWGAAAALAAALAWVFLSTKPARAPLVRFSVDRPAGEIFHYFSSPMVSPDGDRILFLTGPRNGGGEPWVYRVSTGESTALRNLPAGGRVRWSPDSVSLMTLTNGVLARTDLTGARTEILRERASDFAAAPNGAYLLVVDGEGIFWMRPGEDRRRVTRQKPGEGQHEGPQFLPDGKSFLFYKQQTTNVETWLGRLDGGAPKLVMTQTSPSRFAAPDYLLYLVTDSLVAQRFDLKTGALRGEPRSLASGVGNAVSITMLEPGYSVSENGVLAYRMGELAAPGRLTWMDRTGNVIRTLGGVAEYSSPALSPDGKRLAVGIRDSSGKRDIWTLDVERGTRTPITMDPADEANPTWSPDGTEIAYSSDRRGHRDIFAKPASGSGAERTILESPEDKTILDWSSDGKIAYSVLRPQPLREIWILPLQANPAAPYSLTGAPYREDEVAFSPDGRRVIYRSRRENRPADIFLQAAAAKAPPVQVTTTGADDLRWQGDGREIYFLSDGKLMECDVPANGAVGKPHLLFDTGVPPRLGGRNRFDVTRDGQMFLVVRAETARNPETTPFSVVVNWQRLLEAR